MPHMALYLKLTIYTSAASRVASQKAVPTPLPLSFFAIVR